MKTSLIFSLLLSCAFLSACTTVSGDSKKVESETSSKPVKNLEDQSKAYFASGCFWCVEAVFESVEGVSEAISGYAGGTSASANYRDVSAGRTKHAEAVEVYYDPAVVSYETLLIVFFDSHDPTTLNRQGNDSGPQYRSAIFYQNETEKAAVEAYVQKLKKAKTFRGDITTEIAPLDRFYAAEDYHQDYERKNPDNSYVRAVSVPRLNRFKKKHPELLKTKGH